MERSILRQTETLDSVGAGATGEMTPILDGYAHVRMLQVEAACQSSDFDLMIYDRQDGEDGSINEIYRAEGVEGHLVDDEFYSGGRLFFNSDTEPKRRFYARVRNNDQSQATGPITLRLYFFTVPHSEME